MPKRGSNIYKRKDGRFEGRIPVGYKENGTLKYKSVYDRTLSGVKEKMAQFYSVRSERTCSSLKLTVCEAAAEWLSAAKLRVKPASYANYANTVAKHILPVLGGEYFSGLTTQKSVQTKHPKQEIEHPSEDMLVICSGNLHIPAVTVPVTVTAVVIVLCFDFHLNNRFCGMFGLNLPFHLHFFL